MGSRDDLSVTRVNNPGLGGATSLMRHLQVLRTVTEAVSRSLDLNEVIQQSLGALTQVTGHEIASLHLVSPTASGCCCAASAASRIACARST